MIFNASILVGTKDIQIVSLNVPKLKTGQILVKMKFAGVCGSQKLEWNGGRGEDKWLPHCFGHEGVGEVLEVGPGVTKVKADDRVILTWLRDRGISASPPNYVTTIGKAKVNSGPISVFQEMTVVSENCVYPMPDWMDWLDGVAYGCALPVGFGAVSNVLKPKPGMKVVVFGAGGVGLFAIRAASLCGCSVTAIDLNRNALHWASGYGASETNESFNGPYDYDCAVDCTGNIVAMQDAVSAVKGKGGKVVIVGNTTHSHNLEIPVTWFNQGKSVLGTWGGEAVPSEDFPRLFQLHDTLCTSDIMTEPYGLCDLPEIFRKMESGEMTGRPLIMCHS